MSEKYVYHVFSEKNQCEKQLLMQIYHVVCACPGDHRERSAVSWPGAVVQGWTVLRVKTAATWALGSKV
jgi:hypothetical protein